MCLSNLALRELEQYIKRNLKAPCILSESIEFASSWQQMNGQMVLLPAESLRDTQEIGRISPGNLGSHEPFCRKILDNNMAIFNPNENASDFQPVRVGSKCNKSIQRIRSFHGLNTCDPKRKQIIYDSIPRIQKWHPLGSTNSWCFVTYLPIMVSRSP